MVYQVVSWWCFLVAWHAAFGVAWSAVACYGYLWQYFQYWWVLLMCLRELQWELNNLTRTWLPVSQYVLRERDDHVHCFAFSFKWTQWQPKLCAQSSEHGTRMVTYNDTNTNGLGVPEDRRISILTLYHGFFCSAGLAVPKVCKVEVFC